MSERIDLDLEELLSSIRTDVESLEQEIGTTVKDSRNSPASETFPTSENSAVPKEESLPDTGCNTGPRGTHLNRWSGNDAFSVTSTDESRRPIAQDYGCSGEMSSCKAEVLEKLSEIEENLTRLGDQMRAISHRSNPIPNVF